MRGTAFGLKARVVWLVVAACVAALLAYAVAPRAAGGPYELADDCPRGALVYAQVSDLPALVGRWRESELKTRYLDSTSFRQFKNGHVALKLVERLSEFGGALGFALDADALAGAVDKRAAVAVYDIGRLELVIVARAGEGKVLASRFFAQTEEFEATELPGGLTYYSREVDADRGRQRQKILFAAARGRFVLATGEQLMLRALANIEGKARNDRLSDDASFKTLSAALEPHLLTVWVDQSRLNDDWYFKQYWAMRNVSELKSVRAGMFDFEERDGGWLERREFLTRDARARTNPTVPARHWRDLANALPPAPAYARLRVLTEGPEGAASLVRDALLDRLPRRAKGEEGRKLYDDYYFDSDSDDSPAYDNYAYLGDDYDELIDEAEEGDTGAGDAGSEAEARALSAVARALAPASPLLAGAAESPVAVSGPLFAEFRRAAVLTLREPAALDREGFERALASLVGGRLTAAGEGGAGLAWAGAGAGASRRRELRLPMLGWMVCYALKGRELIVANDAALLSSALEGAGDKTSTLFDRPEAPDDVTVIRFEQLAQSFAPVMNRLDAARVKERARQSGAGEVKETISEEFMSGNVASLLDVASPVARVEVRRRASPGRLRVEVEIVLKQLPKEVMSDE